MGLANEDDTQRLSLSLDDDGHDEGLDRLLPHSPGTPSKGPGVATPSANTLGALGIALISYAAVAGGAFGIEQAVGVAGPLPTIIGCLVLALVWSAPQALISAEMACMYPSNAGYVGWALRGLGPVLGFVGTANSVACAVCCLPLFPVMFAGYLSQQVPELGDGALWAIKITCVLLAVAFNISGLRTVEVASGLFTIVSTAPFVIMPIAAAAYGQPFDWPAVATVAPNFTKNLAVFLSVLCWNSQGWPNVGNIAAEVHNPQRAFRAWGRAGGEE